MLSGGSGEPSAPVQLHYAPGEQWQAWRGLPKLTMGSELERSICAAYQWIARRWRPGDPLFLFGYSRGAFAVRSLAGMIGRVGLLTHHHATPENVARAWSLYRNGPDLASERLQPGLCHAHVPIRMIGVFDTVMALGIRLPLLWMLTEPRFRFHDEHLGDFVEYGAQALALDETRAAFHPLIWDTRDTSGRIEQMWFRGCHADIGGQLSGYEASRPLANIPLVWMMSQAETRGLPLPQGWQDRFVCDVTAPSVGSWAGWGKAFLARAARIAGRYPTEFLHPSVPRPYPGPALLVGAMGRDGAQRRRRGQHQKPPTGTQAQAK